MKFPNKIYRYRSFNQNSLKEILYGELFLASRDELNDPYDTNVNFVFYKNYDRYKRFLDHYIHEILIKTGLLTIKEFQSINTAEAINKLNSSNLTYPNLIELISSPEFKSIIIKILSITKNLEVISITDIFIRDLRQNIHKQLSGTYYICSFSKIYDEPIIWSHYAGNHTGFCLQFTPVNNEIYPNNNREKPLKIEQIYYKKKINNLDAFLNFNAMINNRNFSIRKSRNYWDNFKTATLTKSEKWSYEQEVRITKFNSPKIVTTDGPEKLPTTSRIFHYDQTQLTGIILGSLMNEKNKNEVLNTIFHMRNNL
ncbi:DUF2971 domain-containing protein, partial [Leptospira bouyouniensis]|uniref:DUF2971 domain-containing protein n=1 Tax=Leptospira bouyouniensis TaxID=2484911 RepID=UPI001090C26B